ncbi:MAG: hypothetical protein PHU31_11715 [Anaerotignum sp.]|nr:hypothetical protein [Anaerotignum sp.]
MNEIEAIEIIKKVDICCNAAETARDLAIQALQEKLKRENPQPLGLEEIKLMDGVYEIS